MTIRKAACLLFVLSLSATAQTVGWKVIRDKTSACQVSVPPSWKIDDAFPGSANAPGDQGYVIIRSYPGKKLTPLTEATQKGLMFEKLLENTSQLLLFYRAPMGSNPQTYRADAPGNGAVCEVSFSAKGLTEDLVKKIAQTIKAANWSACGIDVGVRDGSHPRRRSCEPVHCDPMNLKDPMGSFGEDADADDGSPAEGPQESVDLTS